MASKPFEAYREEVVSGLSSNRTFVYVSSPDHEEADFDAEFHRVSKSNAITVGTCQGAHTTSAMAGVMALEDHGSLTFCPGDHNIYGGLHAPHPHFTLKGMDRDLSRLVPWPATETAIIGSNIVEANFEDLTIVNRNIGIKIDFADSIRIERVNIVSSTQLTNSYDRTRCLFSSYADVSFVDSVCTNVQEGLSLPNIKDVNLSGSTIASSEVGVSMHDAGTVVIQDNEFTGSPRAITLQDNMDYVTITGNDITQEAHPNHGVEAVFMTLKGSKPYGYETQSTIQANIVRLAGAMSSGFMFAYVGPGKSVLFDLPT